jgi:DNA-binding CsgD family transcriptional regulator
LPATDAILILRTCPAAAWSVQRMPEQFLNEVRTPVADAPAEGSGVGSLTPRERQVLAEIMAGASNKVAGRTLGISPRTIEVHRARIMEKLGAKNACDLVRIVLEQGPRH